MARVPVDAFGPARSCSPSGSGPLRERHSSHGEMSRKSWLPGTSTTSPSAPSASPMASQHGPRGLERLVHRAVAQLEQVAEDHEPVDAVQGAEQGVLGRGPAQDVDVAAGPEVEV